MARQRVKSSLLAKLLGHALAVFIMLSATGECLECYWCGPLAEQVHRSQRAPSCEESTTNVTACEPGYTHCAVVASSPPFVESRYCVKFYQDECYTLYCGTTKTYRTTCPCRGELCNGANTQREIDAFAALSNTVAKTHNNRIKKRNTVPIGSINTNKHRISNLIENDPQDESANLIDNETKNVTTNDNAAETEQPPMADTENLNNSASNTSESHNNDTNASESHSLETNGNESHANEPANHDEIIVTTKAADSAIDEIKETQNKEVETTPGTAEVKQSELATIANPTEAAMKPTETMKADVSSYVSNDMKPSVQIPTAEALQQNANPVTTEKPVEQTVTVTDSTTHMSTLANDKNMTPMPTKSKNNSVTIYFSAFVLLFSLVTNITL